MAIALASVLAAGVSLAQTPAQTPAQTINVTIEKKASPRAHIAHARSLMAKLLRADAEERHAVIGEAAGHLRAVELTWPDEHAAIADANLLLAKLYFDARMPRNVIEVSERVFARDRSDHRMHGFAARAHERLGNRASASGAYVALLDTFDRKRGDSTDNVAMLNAAASFFEENSQHGHAAAALRRAAALDGLMPTTRVMLHVRALEQSARTADRSAAAKDLTALRESYRIASGVNATPAQREVLEIAERTIERFEAMIDDDH